MCKILLLLILLKTVGICAGPPASSPPIAAIKLNYSPHACTAAVFQVIELKMNRTRTITVPLATSVRYNTLVIQPQSCAVQTYAGDHKNTTVHLSVWTLPYRVMIEPKLVSLFPPTLAFSGLISTISPAFAHANYAIIPVGCQTVSCAAGG